MAETKEINNKEGNGLTGLKNLGNTCFMNATLQCLSFTHELNNFLDKETYKNRLNNVSDSVILYEWDNLRKLMWSEDCTISPGGFFSAIRKVAQLKDRVIFTGYAQNDLTEFLNFLIDCFHEAIKREVQMDITGIPQSNTDKLAINCYQMYMRMYSKEYSEILNLFYGIHVSKLEFKDGSYQSTSPEPFLNLNLPIPNKKTVSLYDCFDEYVKKETLDEDNMVINEKSGNKETCTKELLFFSLPNILVIILKRFNNNNNKINKNIDIPLANLNLNKYLIGYEKNGIYDLYGICNHMGTSMGGHYTAHVKAKNNKWYNFDDTRVKEINEKNLISGYSYCLFYRKKKLN
jgi:ubiquitin carboxyl-terminal hydrolase 2